MIGAVFLKLKNEFTLCTKVFSLRTKSAFTLVEMLVVMGIVFIIAAISMVNYNQFGRQVELENAAYEVALLVRTAQFFGINRSQVFGSDNPQPRPYGITIDLSGTIGALDDEAMMVFVDSVDPENNRFDDATPGGQEGNCLFVGDRYETSFECVDILNLNRGNYIADICLTDSQGEGCLIDNANGSGNIVRNLDPVYISFKRPDPEAIIRLGNANTEFSQARVIVRAPVADVKPIVVTIGRSGLIAIEQ